jgi:hypothetical protein
MLHYRGRASRSGENSFVVSISFSGAVPRSPIVPGMSVEVPASPFRFRWGTPVKFSGGKYNGFLGTVRWCGETACSVEIRIDNAPSEVVEDLCFVAAQQPEAPRC